MKKTGILISVLTVICLLTVFSMCFVLINRAKPKSAEFVPPPFDENALEGIPTVTDSEFVPVYKEGMTFKAYICPSPILRDGRIYVNLTNCEENDLYLKLRILDENGEKIAESGLIKPGEYIESVSVLKNVKTGEEIKMKLMSYVPETYESGGGVLLNSKIG